MTRINWELASKKERQKLLGNEKASSIVSIGTNLLEYLRMAEEGKLELNNSERRVLSRIGIRIINLTEKDAQEFLNGIASEKAK
ncbi:MAG: hypothetical protein M1368_06725 [Thaumarchaeota archaeon]|nr:hypothetical protein [Nitrososphaerota archaeon]